MSLTRRRGALLGVDPRDQRLDLLGLEVVDATAIPCRRRR
jgi:hypothetical protein